MNTNDTPEVTRKLADAFGLGRCQRAVITLDMGDLPRVEAWFIGAGTIPPPLKQPDPAEIARIPFLVRMELQPMGAPITQDRTAPTWRVRLDEDTGGQWWFTVVAPNGKQQARSVQSYPRRSGAHRAAEALMGARLEIVDDRIAPPR